jgi:putative membrane protein
MENNNGSVRDKLAVERTKLSEERTQLAYIRTGMNLALGGIFFIGYFPQGTIFHYAGYAAVIIAALFSGYGFYNHKKSQDIINRITLGRIRLKDL